MAKKMSKKTRDVIFNSIIEKRNNDLFASQLDERLEAIGALLNDIKEQWNASEAAGDVTGVITADDYDSSSYSAIGAATTTSKNT